MQVDIVLNVYYLGEADNPHYAKCLTLAKMGLGLYHTGIEIQGVEYSYGGNIENHGSGVFRTKPLTITNATYYQSYNMGTVPESGLKQLYDTLRKVQDQFRADEYSLVH